MLVWAVRALAAHPAVAQVVVAAPPDERDAVVRALEQFPSAVPTTVVAGGATRQESVRLALASLPENISHVLVHDGARPLVPASVLDAVIEALAGGAPAVIPVVPVVDTIKRVDRGRVVATVPRAELCAVQTPQGFRRDVLERAHAVNAEGATDDAGLVEQLGVSITTVPGSSEAFKITRTLDLLLAEAVLAHRGVAHD